MASRRLQRQYAFVLSVLGHAAIVAALTFSIPLSSRNRPVAGPEVVPIDTYMIDAAAVDAEIARIEAAEEAERAREAAEAERIRQEQLAERRELERIQQEREEAEQAAETERIRLQQQAEAEELRLAEVERQREAAERRAEAERLERERLEEIARQEELERQRQEQLAREREEAERRRREAEEAARLAAIEADIQRSIAAEREAQAARDSGLREQWANAIGSRIRNYWNPPANVGPGLECVLIVTQLPDGSVTQVMVEQCSTNDATIIRSVENAVINASPLPPRPSGVPFERQVRIRFIPAN